MYLYYKIRNYIVVMFSFIIFYIEHQNIYLPCTKYILEAAITVPVCICFRYYAVYGSQTTVWSSQPPLSRADSRNMKITEPYLKTNEINV